MRRAIASVLACPVLVFCLSVELLSADDEAPASQPAADHNGNPARRILAPDKAVVKDVVYGLEEEEKRLYLTSQPLDGADRQLKRVELKFTVPQSARVVELSLAKLDGKNLMAVVKLQVGDEFEFHCLTFIGPWESDDLASVTEGVFYFTNCPWPPSGGDLSRFRATSVPQKPN